MKARENEIAGAQEMYDEMARAADQMIADMMTGTEAERTAAARAGVVMLGRVA